MFTFALIEMAMMTAFILALLAPFDFSRGK